MLLAKSTTAAMAIRFRQLPVWTFRDRFRLRSAAFALRNVAFACAALDRVGALTLYSCTERRDACESRRLSARCDDPSVR
jgi:hypothetical protein